MHKSLFLTKGKGLKEGIVMESQVIDLVAKDGIWALLFVVLLFYVLNILSKKIDEIVAVLKENTNVLQKLEDAIKEAEFKNIK